MSKSNNKQTLALAFVLSAAAITCQTPVAKADVFDWSFSGPGVSGSGELVASLDSYWTGYYAVYGYGEQIYDVTSISGSANLIGGDSALPVTGPNSGGGDFADDNFIVYPAAEFTLGGYNNTPPVFLVNGVTFFVGDTQADISYNSYETSVCEQAGYCYRVGNGGVDVTFNLVAGGGAGGGSASPVPEPSTWAMTIVGLGLVGMLARRRNSTPRAVLTT